MEIYEINEDKIDLVATFMSAHKPEWWDFEGAKEQLSGGRGWYFGSRVNNLDGWLLCKVLDVYRIMEIECLGYYYEGEIQVRKELTPLIEHSEAWAKEQGFVLMRFTIGTRGLSCHQRELGQPWEELRDLHPVDREEYSWFLSMGYVPSGVLPNIYGDKYHGILLVKSL